MTAVTLRCVPCCLPGERCHRCTAPPLSAVCDDCERAWPDGCVCDETEAT